MARIQSEKEAMRLSTEIIKFDYLICRYDPELGFGLDLLKHASIPRYPIFIFYSSKDQVLNIDRHNVHWLHVTNLDADLITDKVSSLINNFLEYTA
jgi:hypothetical protein